MGRFLSGFLLPMLFLAAASLNWSFMSMANLLAFLFVQYSSPRMSMQSRRRQFTTWCALGLSSSCIISHVAFRIVCGVKGDKWRIDNSDWAKLIGFLSVHSSTVPYMTYFLVIEVLAAIIAVIEIHCGSGPESDPFQDAFSQLRVLCCLLLPAIQLIVGISHPSWASFPFFIGSCSGLVNWSLTSDILGLFRWWRFLLVYAGLNIFLLYVYQLPIELHGSIKSITGFIGFYKVSTQSEWLGICSGLSLILFYIVLSWIRCDLSEMDSIMSSPESSLTENLLPKKHSFFIYASRSGTMHTNVLLRRRVFRTFSVNFFTYGFPISLLALSVWSFHFASFCAFGLLAYVGYILCAFPSLFHLRWLNGLLLVFILLWAASTYVFNVELTILNKKMSKHMEIWEAIGLWYYPIPGFYLLAQFSLGVLVSLGNLVNNSVFLYLSDGDRQHSGGDFTVEETEEIKVLIVATIAWCLRKCSRAIALTLLFFIALKPGFIHALYMLFFLTYLLSHTISKKICQSLIFLCEAHFATLYILRLDLISKALIKKGSLTMEILSQLGIVIHAGSGGFLRIAALACFCAIHNHGFEMLSAFSEILRHTPRAPIGFSILRAGLVKSVLLSVYTSRSRPRQRLDSDSSDDGRIASYLSAIGKKFLSIYRAYGTYIAVQTILIMVYLVRPNFMSLGYLFFALIWMIGRQLLGRTKRRLWLPLKLYAVTVFVVIYGVSVFISFRTWLSRMIDVTTAFGYNPEASMLMNIWHSLAVLIVMQLYSYERRQSKFLQPYGNAPEESSLPFIRRVLILHSEKILNIALFYAALSPISAFGFLYLIGLVVCSTLPKSSWLPSQLFLVYSGFLVLLEYLFQLWGDQAEMFPGQNLSSLSSFLGLRLYKPGFFGLESGLRGKVLVIFSCILRYNVYHWLETMPQNCRNGRKWEEPCALFSSWENFTNERNVLNRSKPSSAASPRSERTDLRSLSWPSKKAIAYGALDPMLSDARGFEGSNSGKYSYICGSFKENKQSKKRIIILRKERLNLQKSALKVYIKFWIENMFNLFGLEINMIALLVASFAVLNSVSLLYVASLAACILLQRHIVKILWPMFLFIFGLVLILEYLAIWFHMSSWQHSGLVGPKVPCKECWRSSDLYFDHCRKCWLGIIVDDPRHLISYYVVFMLACFKFRSDHVSTLSASKTYQQIKTLYKNALLGNVSFEAKSLWTFFDYLSLYSYCHLLDLVLFLVLITGTFEFDILHFGYLGFALVFFRMRLEILKKKNGIFKFLRIYNFAIVVFSLAYQSPFVGGFCTGECSILSYISQVVGFYKYDYGFRITARSALVEIIIFILVSLQSFMFSTREFDYVSEYLQAEQIASIVRKQEKRAAWRTEQLQQIRKAEEQKRLRNLQVEKMKAEVLNLQIQLRSMSTLATCGTFSRSDSFRRPINSSANTSAANGVLDKVDTDLLKQAIYCNPDLVHSSYLSESPKSDRSENPSPPNSRNLSTDSVNEITTLKEREAGYENLDSHERGITKLEGRKNPLISAVHLLQDGVSQVQCLGNVAVNNLIHFFNIKNEEMDSNEESFEEEVYYEMDNSNIGCEPMDRTFSIQSDSEHVKSRGLCQQIGMILRYIWVKMRSNNDFVCYCCFILIFLWNFSLLSMVYPIVLFVYALSVSAGPNNLFWVVMLIYTEMCILVQYVCQIMIQHCGFTFNMSWLQELGFPGHKIKSSFVVSNLPLFMVYMFTLIQTSITAKDGGWTAISEVNSDKRRNNCEEEEVKGCMFCIEHLFLSTKDAIMLFVRSLCRYWKSLTRGSETPPYFVQLSLKVDSWPADGIQPERIKSGINHLLKIMHDKRCKNKNPNSFHMISRVHVQSIETSPESDDVALAVFEVVCAAPLEDCTHAEFYNSLTPAADVAYEIVEAQRTGVFKELGFPYPILSVIGGRKKEMDLYPYIFCSDFVVFLLVGICYQSIMKNNSEFFEVYQLEDQFPKEFVFVLMVSFFLVVLDRIIYLCSFATGKVLLYFFNFILFTYSVTKYAWSIESQQRHVGKMSLRAIYLAKAISLALQAIQMQFGVPHKSILYRQFLTSRISHLNDWGFRLYRALPFLYELRCVLDWSCTTTSLTMYDWLKLEDIHASLFLVKCDTNLNRAKHQHGEKQTKMTKFCNGICVFFILLGVIWAPMLMYSSGNPTNIANPIKDASIRIDIKTVTGRLTLFETTLCEKIPWTELDSQLDLDPDGYLSAYNEKDIQLICCQPDASSLWLVPPVVQERYMRSLKLSMDIIFSWQLIRDRPKGKEAVRNELIVQQEDLPTYLEVMEVLNGSANSFRIYNIYPRFFRVTGSGEVRLLEQLVDLVSGDLVLNRGSPEWWSFHDIDTSFGCGKFGGPMAIIVSEETPQGIIGDTLSKFSIWGLYITFVLAVGRFIRLQCSDLRMRIPYENLPSCDRLLAICEDIYAARAEGELEVEEVLYLTLVKIYRSSHMLLEYTKTD